MPDMLLSEIVLRAEHTAGIPQNWTPAQGKTSVRICHLTLREVRASFTVLAASPCVLSLSASMSSSSIMRSSSGQSHCKAFIRMLQKKKKKKEKRWAWFRFYHRHLREKGAEIQAGVCSLTSFGPFSVSFIYVKISRSLGEKRQGHKLQQRGNTTNSQEIRP